MHRGRTGHRAGAGVHGLTPAPTPAPGGPSLDDRYLVESGRVFLGGVQALVRLAMDQARRDRSAGLRTGTFVSGYPGSPLGGYDLALGAARHLHERFGIVHRPAMNEESAATALMGTQMLERYPHARYDGVVGFWYGKGPGLDRAGDAVRHGNFAGTTTHGAVVVLSGEDHEAKSSTMPFAQEHYFVHAGMPVLYPASVQEFLDLGLHAVALSRYAGLWVAMKLVGQLCDGGESVRVDPSRPAVVLPDFQVDGRPFRKSQYHRFFPGETVEHERRLHDERLPAATAYARANGLDRVELAGARDRLALVSAGKSWSDLRQALSDLDLDDARLSAGGVRLVKVALLHPADRAFLAGALAGVEEVIVVEEKGGFLEERVREALYDLPDRPRVLGKRDAAGAPLFPAHGSFDADRVASLLGPRLAALVPGAPERVERRLTEIRRLSARPSPSLLRRTPTYCSGCPHNSSTRVLPGQVAWSAPGCHVFATLIEQPERHADATFQLGGEGLAWLGLGPFTDLDHVVQNHGDGALFHSSYLNVRGAVAAGAHLTFRILYNGAVANTGAQPPVGQKDVPTLVRLLALEGVTRVAVVSADPSRLPAGLPEQATVHGREEIEDVLRSLAATPGVTVLLYDGECANERRRKQKRGLRPGSTRFAMVNEEVCENCGHCGVVSNCISLHKVETPLGPKTRIHASTCNQDLLCLEGECPSFVTVDVEGGGPRRRAPEPVPDGALPEPPVAQGDGPYRVVIPGTGGTGVLTVSALLGWAAHLDGKEVLSYDQTGAAQKWGSVLSCLAISDGGGASRGSASKAGLGRADLYLACDLMAASDPLNLGRCDPARTAAAIHTTLFPSGEMIRNVDLDPGADRMVGAIAAVCHPGRTLRVDARRLAEELFDDHLAANVLLLGAASQAGLLPVSARSLEAAIALNGTAADRNLQAFRQGRLHQARASGQLPFEVPPAPTPEPPGAAVEREAATLGRAGPAYRAHLERAAGLPDEERRMLAFRAAELVRYQDVRLAGRYVDRVLQVALQERQAMGDGADLAVTREAIRQLHRLLAYKDEYEVARLHLRGDALGRAREAYQGRVQVHYHLHPPALRALGMRRKVAVGRWIEPGFRLLVAMRRLRGTALDPFGGMESRRLERSLPGWYENALAGAMGRLRPETHPRVLELARLPERIRGYEQVKAEGARQAMARAGEILRELDESRAPAGAP